jgi:rubrerythrin
VPWQVAVPETTEELLRIFEAHTSGEAKHIDAYRDLAQSVADPIVSVLMDLVLEDEERHHDLFRRMTARLRDDVEATRSAEALPYRAATDQGRSRDVADVVESYARDETETARTLRHLAKDARLLYGGLFGLLLDTMADDSEKHERVMRFVLSRISP